MSQSLHQRSMLPQPQAQEKHHLTWLPILSLQLTGFQLENLEQLKIKDFVRLVGYFLQLEPLNPILLSKIMQLLLNCQFSNLWIAVIKIIVLDAGEVAMVVNNNLPTSTSTLLVWQLKQTISMLQLSVFVKMLQLLKRNT